MPCQPRGFAGRHSARPFPPDSQRTLLVTGDASRAAISLTPTPVDAYVTPIAVRSVHPGRHTLTSSRPLTGRRFGRRAVDQAPDPRYRYGHGQADLLHERVARRVRRDPGPLARLGRRRRGGPRLVQRPSPRDSRLDLRPADVRADDRATGRPAAPTRTRRRRCASTPRSGPNCRRSCSRGPSTRSASAAASSRATSARSSRSCGRSSTGTSTSAARTSPGQFIERGLVDEYMLVVHPVAIGRRHAVLSQARVADQPAPDGDQALRVRRPRPDLRGGLTGGNRYQTSPERQSQASGPARSSDGVDGVRRMKIPPSSSSVRCRPSAVRTDVGPSHASQPIRR